MCDNCVEGFDHHCNFLDTCIGKFNYCYFLLFLASFVLLSVLETAGFLIYLLSVLGRLAQVSNDYSKIS